MCHSAFEQWFCGHSWLWTPASGPHCPVWISWRVVENCFPTIYLRLYHGNIWAEFWPCTKASVLLLRSVFPSVLLLSIEVKSFWRNPFLQFEVAPLRLLLGRFLALLCRFLHQNQYRQQSTMPYISRITSRWRCIYWEWTRHSINKFFMPIMISIPSSFLTHGFVKEITS